MTKYYKDFNKWNTKKEKVNMLTASRQCHAGEIWITAIGVNIGNEIDGKGYAFARPILVLKRCNTNTFIGVPLTKTVKNLEWYVPCKVENTDGSINLSQIRLFDQKRLLRLIHTVNKNEFEYIKLRVRQIFV
jgi:mRNA interferase MazF